MKSYKKPTVSVVSLKSSKDFALSYKDIEGMLLDDYMSHGGNLYAVTMFSLKNS